MRTRTPLSAALTCCALYAVPLASAQTVSGRIVEDVTGRPVAGALVTLVVDGSRIAPTLSDERGHFTAVAPAPGRYRVRVDLIGYERWLSPALLLNATTRSELAVELPLRRVTLETVVVHGQRGCTLDQEAQTDAGHIWEEIRRALTISDLTAQQARLVYEWRITERQRSPTGRIGLHYQQTLHGDAVLPWTLRSAELLDREGWVLPEGDSIVFYGPGAETLLSQEFIDGHCFTPVRRPGMVGLEFSPRRARTLPDIAGTIWLDANTSELRRVQFEYRNLPRSLESTPRAGGELNFARLPTGQWYVSRWSIMMPLPGRFFLERIGEARVQ